MADVIVIFLFWAIFWPFTLLTAQKIKISKNGKNPGDIIILHVYQNLSLDDLQFLRYGVRRTNGRMDRRTDRKSDI